MKLSVRQIVVAGLFASLALLALPWQILGQSANRTASKQPADAAQIARLIRQLGSEHFAEREAATKALDAIGEPALPALRKAQGNSDLEIRRRAIALVQILTRRRAGMRAKAWAAVKRFRRDIYSHTETSEGQIGGINFCGSDIRDADLALLHWLDEIGGLGLMGTLITDAGLVHVKKLYNLEVLDLGSTEITSAGLEHLKDIDTLRVLMLGSTRVTDAGLVHLKELKKLSKLDLSLTRITDAGLDQVREIRGLTWLDLSHTQVTDAGLVKLKRLKELSFLELSDTQITDAGLAHLKEIPTLKILWLDKTKVTERAKAQWFEEEIRRAKPSGPKQGSGAR